MDENNFRLLRYLMELKNPHVHYHCDRVAYYSCRIARRLGLQDEEIRRIKAIASLHDVGKLALPRVVLSKEAALSLREHELLRWHPLLGEMIVGMARGLVSLRSPIRSHHERLDGNGYPDGLKGGEIPIASRIIAIADAYDAMVNDRPYRQAVPLFDALEEIKRGAGSQFDADLVSEFLEELFERYEKIPDNFIYQFQVD